MAVADKVWTKNEIVNLLKTSNKMVVRSLIKLYDCQTQDELDSKETISPNGIGFNMFDAKELTNIAENYIKCGTISNKNLDIVRRKIMKYAGQLTNIANHVITVS